jgi:prevent-host-death family protein
MKVVSVTAARRNFGALLDAAQEGPALIRRRNRNVAVIMSVEEYLRIGGIKRREFDEGVPRPEGR